MIKVFSETPSASASTDPNRNRQTRREQGIEWSERMLKPEFSKNGISKAGTGQKSMVEKHDLENTFFSMLLDEQAVSQSTDFEGTLNSNSSLNKQEGNKKNVELEEQFYIKSDDFGSAKVEVKLSSNVVLLHVVVEQPLPVQHISILQKLVASRLGQQFGKNFEVQITCKN